MTANDRDDHVVWFATASDRDRAGRLLPFASCFGEVYATVDSNCLTAAELEETLSDHSLEGLVVVEPELAPPSFPGP